MKRLDTTAAELAKIMTMDEKLNEAIAKNDCKDTQ